MKKTGKLIAYISAAFIILFSVVFIVIEGRTLFSGDWLLFENATDGFFRYFFRLLIALYALFLSISTYIVLGRKRDNTVLAFYFTFGVLAFLVSSIIMSIFASNYIDILLLVLPLIYSLGVMLFFYSHHIKIAKKD